MRDDSNCVRCANNSYVDYPNNQRPCSCWRGKLVQLENIGKESKNDRDATSN